MKDTSNKKNFDWGALGTILALISIAFAVGVFVQTRAVSTQSVDERIKKLEGYLAQVPPGTILPWDPIIRDGSGKPTGQLNPLPKGWAICNGLNGTPNLVGIFLMGAADQRDVGKTGGRADIPADGDHTPSGSVGISKGGPDGRGFLGKGEAFAANGSFAGTRVPGHTHGGENRPPFYSVIYVIKLGNAS